MTSDTGAYQDPDAASGAARFDALLAEGQSALAYSANSLKKIRDRYRDLHADELTRWHDVHDERSASDRRPVERSSASGPDAAAAAEAGAEDHRRRALRSEADALEAEVGRHRTDLGRLELAIRHLEATWLFLERGDSTLVTEGAAAATTDVQMRIVEAQEAERARLAQEVHDGPAQSLSNAIFQVEYIERVLGQDTRLAATELRFLRELLRRELGELRTFISQLRPPVLDELGLEGALRDAVETSRSVVGADVQAHLTAPSDGLSDAQQTVALRVLQEALQNIRKHAKAQSISVSTRVEGREWVLEVRDDGRGFDVGAVAARGRRNFGLQFMRERAELIEARLDVRSRPDGGTVVRLAIPEGAEESR